MPFADDLLGLAAATNLADAIKRVSPPRTVRELPKAARALDGLSVSSRADLLAAALLSDVGDEYPRLAATVRRAAAEAPDFSGWLIWPVTSAVATAAVRDGSPEAFTDAMTLLAELTGRLTSEFAIRTLLRHDLDRALNLIRTWTGSEDEHIRRLASEGTRPYLPWAVRIPRITAQPGITVAILDSLYRDPSEYVRRSVANHLNDLSRESPDLVVDTAGRWLATPAPGTPAVVRHALRTLIKRGHPDALALLGFGPASVDIDGPHLDTARVSWGGTVRFTAAIQNSGTDHAQLAIDYVVHHRKANGSLTEKVFKLATCALPPGERFQIDRSHSFRAITTRRYYPGAHAIALQVNGVATDAVPFELLPADD